LGSECAEGICSYMPNQCPGTCAPYQGTGSSCDFAGLRCDPATAFCHATSRFCIAYQTVGQSCGPSTGAICAPGLACQVPTGGSQTGPCMMIQPEGGACTTLDDCAQPLGCTDGHCATVVAAGDRCRSQANCPQGLKCGLAPGQTTSTCQGELPPDAECVDS